MCPLAIYMSSLVICLFWYFHFSIELLVFCCWFVWVLHTFWILTPYQIYYLKISSPHFVDSFLCCAKASEVDVVPFVYFCFCFPCLKGHIQKNITKTVSKNTLYIFCFRSFMISDLIFKSIIHFKLFLCMVWENSLVWFFLI